MIQGGCLCGAVKFEIDGPLSPAQYCHAERCRKASGAAFATEAAARSADFKFVCGVDMIDTYEAPLLREPPPFRRDLCRGCGSPVPVPLADTGYMVVQLGILDGDIDAKVFRHIFTSQAASWFEGEDDLPKFELRPPPNARVPNDEDMS